MSEIGGGSELEARPESQPAELDLAVHLHRNAVYYVPPICCDVSAELYDRNGSLICSPDGGIAGDGDGKCPDFFDARTDEKRVWADTR